MKKKLLCFALLFVAISVEAQLVVTPGGGVSAVSSAVGGPGLTISNVTINCNNASYGAFSGGAASGMGISNGLILSTGSVSALPGTGNSDDDFDFCVGAPYDFSDPQLTALSSSAELDVCVIEFDVVPQCSNMSITFVFGSDEYTNWVNQTFNDAFGFFVSGPNPLGGSYSNVNIATIPGGTPVSVDNVSHLTNTTYFVNNNAGGAANHFDGFTTVLTPSISVTPCQTYHFKLAIADATDCSMDSGVLIDLIQCTNIMSLSNTNTPASTCGVNDGTANITVTNGFGPFTYTWSPTPGAGQGTANATGLSGGTTYTVTVDDVYACIIPVTTTVTIGGPVTPTIAVNSPSICDGGSTTLTGTPSAGGGTFSWAPGGETTNAISVNPSSTTTYTCSYTLSGCTGTTTATVTVNPQPNVSSQAPVCSGLAAFNLTTSVAGGTWSGSGITNASAGTFTPGSAAVGNNVITYTAPGGCTDTVQIMVTATSNASWTPPAMCILDASINLNTLITGTAGGTWSGTGVTGNTFDPNGLPGNNAVTYSVGSGPCAATSTLNIVVSPNIPPIITPVADQCSSVNSFNLAADIAGGTWTGTGITNASSGTFDPGTATVGTNQIIYTIAGSCAGSDTIQITVNPSANAAWTQPISLCAVNSAISLDSLITGTTGGAWSGTGVTGNMFDPAGLSGNIPVTYIVGSICPDTLIQNITVIPPSDPDWTTTTVCGSSAALNLDTMITGTAGGTWSGTGVTGSSFDPAGLSGNIAVTYTVGTAPCTSASTQNINVIAPSNPAWTATSMCSSASIINLDSLITGTTGGTWSGTGVTGNSFDPAGLSGGIAITYLVGPVGCQDSLIQNITVTPASSSAWTTTAICASAATMNLDALITGTAGGTWSGTGVTGNTFDPTGLSGAIAVTYTVGTAPCVSVSTQNITVTTPSNPAWTPTSMCSSATVINLDSLITGTTGGTWSGTGVTGNSFNPSGLSGAVSITYTVGPVGCQGTSTQNITVTPASSAAWTTTTICPGATPINLNTLITGTTGGTWSGTGVTGNMFNPAGLSGAIAVTYTVGTSPCVATSTQNITVSPSVTSTWTTTSLCASAASVSLNGLITGTTGGTWSGTGVTGSTFNPAGLSGPIAVTYTVGTAPCSSTTTQNITVIPDANATITSVPSLCANASSTTLTAANTGGVWSGTGITNPSTGTFNPATAGAGTYTITYTIAGACGDTDTVLVTVLPVPSSAWTMPANICENGSSLNLNSLVSGAPGGTWSGSGVTGSTFDPSGLSGNQVVTYSVTQAGCTSTTTQVVNVEVIDAAFTASPTTGMAPVTVNTVNTSTSPATYSWNFGDGATSNAINPSNTYNSFGDYTITLTATSANGCVDVAQVVIHVEELSSLVVPNIFTPNGDGINDTFLPVIAEGLSEFHAVVYDRWGLKMSEWSDVSLGWNGKARNGSVAPDGTYYYIITGKGVDSKDYELTGFVQLFNQR